MKLVKKLPRFSLVSLVFVFLLVVGGLFWFITDLLTEKQTEILTSKKDIAVLEIGGELNQIESLLTSVGVSIENGADLVLVEATINEIADQNQYMTQVFYGLEDGSYIITADDYNEDIDVTQRPWYIQAKNAGQSTYTNAYIDEVTNRPVITISVPVYDGDNQLMGVIGADVSILTITAFLQDLEYGEGGYGFLLDASNQIIGHPSMDADEDELLLYDDFDIPIEDLNQPLGITDYIETDGRTGKIAYEYINHSGFVFGIFMTRAELTQSVRTFMIASMAVLALFLVSFVIIIFIYRQHIEKPMDVLIQDINLIDVQNKPDYRLSINNDNSFKNARMALNTLIDTSVRYQKQLEDSMAELSLENQKFESLLSSSSDIVFVIDKQGRYVDIYGSIKEAIGISKQALIGKTHEEVFGTKYAKERQIQYNRALSGERVLYSWESKTRGKSFYFENVINPMFNQENEIIGAVGVARDITEQENRYKQLVYISTHDYLTDLYNRKVYDDELEKLSRQRAYPFAVLNFDFNGLKLINDAYGHIYGDMALKKTAEILKQYARKEDVVCRVSGDEFSVIMPQAKKKDVDNYKQKIQQAFKKTKVNHMSLSVAMGYFIQKDHLTSLDEVRKIAENNMYKQKILDRKSVKNKAISAILKTLTDKYDYEKKHSEEVRDLSIKIGKALNLDDEAIKALGTAAMFHDIGKISLPDNLLNKAGKLSKEEYEVIKTHTTIGYDILNTADEYSELAIHASSHHERYDGKGYPNGLKGDQIPLFSRIIAVADAYEAMTSDRPYRKKMDKNLARQEIIDHSGTQFDPLIAKIFVKEVLDKENPSL